MIQLISTLNDRRAASDAGCRQSRRPRSAWLLAALALISLDASTSLLPAADDISSLVAQAGTRCVVYELYVKPDDKRSEEARQVVQSFVSSSPGLKLQVYNMDEEGAHQQRYETISKYFRLEKASFPAVFSLNYLAFDWSDAATLKSRLEAIRTMHVYVRTGCPKCAAAKQFLPRVQAEYPGLRILQHDVVADPQALADLQKTANRYRQQATSLPAFHFCNSMTIGFISEQLSGKTITDKLMRWTVDCPRAATSWTRPIHPDVLHPGDQPSASVQLASIESAASSCGCEAGQVLDPDPDGIEAPENQQPDSEPPGDPPPAGSDPSSVPDLPVPDLPLPPGGGDDLPLPDLPLPGGDGELPPPPLGDSAGDLPPPGDGQSAAGDVPRVVELPVVGEVDWSRLGMPAFTILIGLIDGFNPCAMWVLLFLLSLLVNLKNRARILAVAGTFVLISGLAYFAFMAAWLNVFMLIGYLRRVQLTLGGLAVLVGTIHVKDFFAFKKGVSLSIPESAKPGIYARTRHIIMAENLTGAILGAITLAVLVNIVELLCTAGLPALYTNILMLKGYPSWKNYAYLGLYNVAYMFDDALMVGLVVLTLDKYRLQERGGRWLKLVSGAAILLLGLVMIFKPELLA